MSEPNNLNEQLVKEALESGESLSSFEIARHCGITEEEAIVSLKSLQAKGIVGRSHKAKHDGHEGFVADHSLYRLNH